MEKYRNLRLKLLEQNIISTEELFPAPLASREQILLVHSEQYYDSIENGSIEAKAMKEIGFPWSERIILRSRASVGGFIAACSEALNHGVSGNLSGGTHHAHRDKGEGFCVFNDFAIASTWLIHQRKIKSALILDLDVHQGNGNSSILNQSKDIFICSMHGKNNYPFRKISGHLDVDLPDHCNDEIYHHSLDETLNKVAKMKFDLILYQAGVDPLKNDRFGKLDLSLEGLRLRDRKVFNFAYESRTPIAIALGGGYSDPIEDTITAHCNTYREAKLLHKKLMNLL